MQWVILQLTIHFYSTILVDKFSTTFIRGIIQLFLHMGRRGQANRIPLKATKRRVFCRCVLKISSKEKNRRIVKTDWQHLWELLIYRFIIKNWEIWSTLAIEISKYNKLERPYSSKEWTLFYVNLMRKLKEFSRTGKKLELLEHTPWIKIAPGVMQYLPFTINKREEVKWLIPSSILWIWLVRKDNRKQEQLEYDYRRPIILIKVWRI
jgi:hypothetical protein